MAVTRVRRCRRRRDGRSELREEVRRHAMLHEQRLVFRRRIGELGGCREKVDLAASRGRHVEVRILRRAPQLDLRGGPNWRHEARVQVVPQRDLVHGLALRGALGRALLQLERGELRDGVVKHRSQRGRDRLPDGRGFGVEEHLDAPRGVEGPYLCGEHTSS